MLLQLQKTQQNKQQYRHTEQTCIKKGIQEMEENKG